MTVEHVLLILAAFATSIISGLVGLAGGILLLGSMTFFMPLRTIIPIHGLIQLISNLSRTLFLRQYIHQSYFIAFALGVPFGGYLGYHLLAKITQPEWLLFLIAALLLYVAFKPKKFPSIKLPIYGFSCLGVIAACLGSLVGASGPLLAPFFIREDWSKEQIVATKAASQILIHLVKIPIFIALAFEYKQYLPLITYMSIATVFGSKIGTWALLKINTDFFWKILRVICILLALRLIVKIV